MKTISALLAAVCLVSLPVSAAEKKPAENPSDAKLYAAWHAACAKDNTLALDAVTKMRHDHPTAAVNEQTLVHAFNQMHTARKPNAGDLSNMQRALQSGNRTPYLIVKICFARYTLGMMPPHR